MNDLHAASLMNPMFNKRIVIFSPTNFQGKSQLSSERIYESLLEGRAEISVIFGWDFGRNDDLIKSF